jgi:predicted nucleic acid-binding protein
MKKRVYIETTIVSYLTARTSRDATLAVHQKINREWWERRRAAYDLRVSQFVLDEAGDGDREAAAERLAALRGVPVLADSPEARALAKKIVGSGLLPEAAVIDALHLAMATVHEVDVLLTWNCRHLANAAILGEIGRLVRMNGYEMPIVCTPEELMGGEDEYQ